jgi:two-component system, chemotaxis family, CheB/CheR fusion protein
MPFDNELGLERGPSSRRVRILVVDDHPDIVETFSRLIRMSGYEVVAARDGGDALKKAAEFHPSIILLDIGLPVLDGYEVIRRLRVEAEFRATPVVAVTGYGGVEDRLRIRDAGFDGHLVKPVPLDVLLETLSRFAAGLA